MTSGNSVEIFVETELLENKKHAVVLSPEIAFETLQTPTGSALFFSIGTDGIFYLTREIAGSSTGWTRRSLSNGLSAFHNGASVRAKSFDLSQNKKTLAYDLALVVTVGRDDFLYVSLGNVHTEEAWEDGVQWVPAPFNSTAHEPPSPLKIEGVYLMNLPPKTGSTPVQNCFVDILRRVNDPLKLLDRYYIDLKDGSSPQWNRHTLPIDVGAGSVTAALGRRPTDSAPGIFTFGTVGTAKQLVYLPQYVSRTSLVPPRPSRLVTPQDSTAIASALNKAGNTNLFLAAAGGLYLYTENNQKEQSVPVLVVPSTLGGQNILGKVLSPHASTVGSTTAVWSLNTQGKLVYMTCPSGSEATPSAWSMPLPIASQVESFAFYINKAVGEANIVFCHLAGGKLQRLSQDPTTLAWSSQSILLPPTEVEAVSSFDAFTSQITITKDGLPAADLPVHLISDKATAFQANDLYTVLKPGESVPVNTDGSGVLTVIQEAKSLASGVCFRVRVPGDPDIEALVDPLAPVMDKLSTIKTGSDFDKFEGLVLGDVPAGDKDAAAEVIQKLSHVRNELPASITSSATASVLQTATGTPANSGGFGLTISPAGPQLHNLTPNAPQPRSTKKVKSGGILSSLMQGLEVIKMDFVRLGNGAWKVLVSIKDTFIELGLLIKDEIGPLLDQALEWVKATWETIKTAFLDIFLPWSDIKRTKDVFKAIFNSTANSMVEGIQDLEDRAHEFFTDLSDNIQPFKDGIGRKSKSTAQLQRERRQAGVERNPKANFFSYHLMNATTSLFGDDDQTAIQNVAVSQVAELLQNLIDLVEEQVAIFKTSAEDIKDVIDNMGTMEPVEVLIALAAIFADVFVDTAGNAINKLIRLFRLLISGVVNIMKAKIKIPVISPMYKEFFGSDLTYIDVVCLVIACPTTVLCKIFTGGDGPFPDEPRTHKIIASKTLSELRTHMWPGKYYYVEEERQRMATQASVVATHDLISVDTRADNISAQQPMEKRGEEQKTRFLVEIPHEELKKRADKHLKDAIDRTDFALALCASVCGQVFVRFKTIQLISRKGREKMSPNNEARETDPLGRSVDIITTVFYLGVIAPNATSFAKDWKPDSWTYGNGAIAMTSWLKTFLDLVPWDDIRDAPGKIVLKADGTFGMQPKAYWQGYISPMLDTLISLAWTAVTVRGYIVAKKRPESVHLSFVYNMFGNIAGYFAWCQMDPVPDKIKLVGAIGMNAGMYFYSLFALAQGLAILYEDD